MPYTIRLTRGAAKALRRKIRPEDANRIREAIRSLAESPRPFPQSAKLEGRAGRRLRVGDYRVLYTVDDDRREVLVVEVWHRQRDYR